MSAPSQPVARRSAPQSSLLGTAALAVLLVGSPLLAVDGLDDLPDDGLATNFFDLGAGHTDQAFGCAAQADGRIVLAGSATDDDGEESKIVLTRFLTDGTRDTGFGVNSRVIIDMSELAFSLKAAGAQAVVLDAQERILVVGTATVTTNGDVLTFVLRLLSNGTIDQTFLFNGISGGWYFSSFLEYVSAAALDPAGNLWILGPELPNLTGGWSFLRLDPNGLEFASETVPVSGYSVSSPTSILFQPDSKPILGGWGQQNGPPVYALPLLIRLLAGGPAAIPDPSFGFTNDGWLNLDYAQASWMQSMALLPNGGIVVAGQSGAFAAEDLFVQRLTPNGVSDGSSEEYVAFDLGGSGGDGTLGAMRMVAQSDGKVVVAARALTGDPGNTSQIGIARLLPNNDLDPSFGGLGTGKRVFALSSPPPGAGDDVVTCLLLAAGMPVVAGWGEYIAPDTDFAFRRLANSLIFSDGLESGSWFFWSDAAF